MRRHTTKMGAPKWELHSVAHVDWKPDPSGAWTTIHALKDNGVRIDVFDKNDEPLFSIAGNPEDVRKALARTDWGLTQSGEHLAYIGYELARAALLGPENYVQD